jgi:hypothetical protein
VGCAAVAVRRIPTETSSVEGYHSAHPLDHPTINSSYWIKLWLSPFVLPLTSRRRSVALG